MPQPDVQRAAVVRPDPHRVELLARVQVPDPVRQPQALGAGPGDQVEQVRRGQLGSTVAQQPLHEVGLQSLLEQREAGAGTHIGAERDPHSVVEVPAQREQPAAQRGVAGRAVRDGGALRAEQPQLPVGRVHVVRQHAPRADQAVPVVGVDVVVRVVEQGGHLLDLGQVLVDVRGEPGPGYVLEHRAAGVQHRLAGGEREPRRHRVPGVPATVPAAGQLARLCVGLLRCGQQLWRLQQPVADHQPGGDPQPYPRRLGEHLVHGSGEVGTEHQRGGGARVDQAADEVGGHVPGVAGVGQPGLLRQRALAQPVQQRHAQPGDHPHLREVHVGVDHARQQDPVAQVDHLEVAMVRTHPVVRSAGGDPAVLHQ